MRHEIKKIQELMEAAEYVTDAPIATSVHLALALGKPLLIEGHAGVGKTEVAKVMARMLGTNLIRLQCYEGLDASTALYEWNYQKQLLHIKLTEESNSRSVGEKEHEIFSEPFLLRRPLLQAISQEHRAPVLLVDEVDRCVAADTLITTSSGVKRAQDVQAGDELVSFAPDEFQAARARVRKVIPRTAPSLLQILVGGRLLEVTPEHRFVRYSDAGYEVVQAAELRVGDRIPLHKNLPETEPAEPRFEFADQIGVSRSHLRNVIQPVSPRDSLRAGVLEKLVLELGPNGSLTSSENGHRDGVCQSVAFYELLGYIVADGCFRSARLCIADKDRANLEVYARKFEEAFGQRPRIVRGPHENYELTCHSLPLGRFLRRVLGHGMVRSRPRMVPEFVFSLPRAKRAGFVRGFFDGEGWVGDHQVSAASSSRYLLVGIQCLLSSLGVDSHIVRMRTHPGNFGRGPFFALTASDVGAFVKAVGFCSPAKQARIQRPPTRRFTRTETLPRQLVAAALSPIRGRGVLNGMPSHQTVYDILAGRVRPNVSSLRKIAGSLPAPELDDLLQRGVVLGEVTSIETVEGPQAVYDFVIDGHPYFVANQVVTHNCDEEFEAFMLEVFSDWQVTIPEIGTIKATHPPHVVLTSNRTRELSDALRRRCLYLWIDYPSFEKEVRIVELKVPGINHRIAVQVARFMEALRRVRLSKVPGVAEALDWAQALVSLHADHLEEALVHETLGVLLKDADDMKRFRAEVAKSGLTPFLPAQS
ncbi:MAG TPA: LAGLIDADG family homing endonuclease [Methylomirabilota bacterium]|nr:LAGLIDADG family homing endonuclease [Methylomirabilota bacterium]